MLRVIRHRLKPVLLLLLSLPAVAAQKFDVVVYGGTAGGVIAAVSAAREGLKTALIEPGHHLGGMVSGGLSDTDYGKKEVIGGYALEFYARVAQHYQLSRYGVPVAWYHEPHVAENIFRQMLREAHVTVFENHRLREKNGVRKEGAKLLEIELDNGDTFAADIFMDSSYEGDLMAQAGISYTYGREGAAQYDESLAGVRGKTPYHQFLVNISPYDDQHRLLPEISSEKLLPPGSPDKKVQSYNFRMCLSEVPENMIPFPKPEGYDPHRYELLARLIAARTQTEGKVPSIGTFLKIDPIPNGKADINNNGAFSTDYIGGSYDYPEGDYRTRARVWKAHRDYQAGLFYFLANDPKVPEVLRNQVNHWGLAKDEFVDTDHWPNQLYIREARRMIGDYVVIQKDLQTELAKPDVIGMGSYNSDSHNLQRIVDADGFVRNEGDMQVATKPYQIPYRVMLPKRTEAGNLLVPVCFSASHVAYSSLRMEPQYMIIGQAAGVAAKLAIANRKAVQEIDTAALSARLKKQGAVFEYVPTPQISGAGLVHRTTAP
jgi:hypothetical protein